MCGQTLLFIVIANCAIADEQQQHSFNNLGKPEQGQTILGFVPATDDGHQSGAFHHP